jgi:hypothetical protein
MPNFLIAADPISKKEKKALAKEGKVYLHPADEESEDFDPRNELQETMQDTAFGAAQGATFNLADEGYGALASALGDGTYEENRNIARKAYGEAKARTPIGTTVGEIGGAVLSPANKLVAGGQGVRGIVQGFGEGALQSYGATDKENLKDQAIETVVGGGVGAATGGIMNLLTKSFSKSPNAIRSEVLGVKAKDYKVEGPADRKKIVDRIKDTGMLKNHKMEYDVNQMKFVQKSKNKFKLDELEKNTEDRLLNRAQDAVEKLQLRKEDQFGEALNSIRVDPKELNDMAQKIADEYSKRGLTKGPIDRLMAAGQIAENIKQQLAINGGNIDQVSLKDLDMVKRMAQEDVKNFSKSLGELGDTEELARITARNLKNLVETKIGSEQFKKINSAQHDFLTIKGDLSERIKSLELSSPTRESYGRTGMLDRTVEGASGSSQGRLNAADLKENYNKYIPESVRAVLPYAAEEAPGAIFRQNFQGNEMKGNWREPQSTMITPRELINYKIPTNTEAILADKERVVAKLVQNNVPDEMVNIIAQALDGDTENIGDIAPLIMTQFPTIFEKSKYKVFDGKFIDPNDKARVSDAISKRDDLNSIQRAKMINQINKKGEMPQGL